MGLVGRLLERRSSLATPEDWLVKAFGGRASATGLDVSETTALYAPAVYSCVRVVAETLASLPLPVYRRLPAGGRERAAAHPLYSVLHDAPNPEMTAFAFREAALGHLLLWGNAYAEIVRDGAGNVRELWLLDPSRTKPTRARGQITYEVRLASEPAVTLPAERVLHIPAFSHNGLVGYSVIGLQREAVASALALQEFGNRFFGNGARPGGVLQHPGKLSDQAYERLRTEFELRHGGLSNAQRLAILEEGLTYQQIGIPPEDAQFLESRKFSRSEIAGLFRVPPHMIGDLERATFSNIEHQAIEFVVHTLRPWAVRVEQVIHRTLLTPAERRTFYAEHLVDGLLRGDIKSRYEALAIARQNGVISADEWRELENMNPQPDGQGRLYLVPLNMVPADQVANPPAPEPEPQPGTGSARRSQSRALAPLETRAAESRRRLAASYRRVFADAARRIVKREEADILREARRQLGKRAAVNLREWLADFYRAAPSWIAELLLPALEAYAEAIGPEAMEEIGAEPGNAPNLATWLREHAGELAAEHAAISESDLLRLLEAAQAGGWPDEDLLAGLEQKLSGWREDRPATIAELLAVSTGAAVACQVWRRQGIRRLRWHAFGGSCPYCRALSGRVVGIDDTFLDAGADFAPEGAAPLRPRRPVRHAPAHRACDCTVVPG